MSGTQDLAEIAALGGTYHLFNEAALADLPTSVPVFPKPGTYRHPAYGDITFTAERIANFVQNFKAQVYQKHLAIDAEHETKLSGALGYITDMMVNDDGSADASVEWTDRGQRLVASNRFKYVSPEWYDRWEQPDTNVEFQDVLVGLALTTRPFLKDANGALRPLVAREGELIAPPADKEGPAHVTTEQSINPHQPKGQTMSESVQMTEEVAKQFKELEGRVTAAEQARSAAEEQAKTFAEQITAIRAENELKSFKDEVRGKSDANDIPYVGDVQYHVETLQALPVERRQAYMERERKIAAATRAKAAGLFAELGSDVHAIEQTAHDLIDTKARTLAASESITYEQAYTRVLNGDAELQRRYVAERKG